MLAIQLKRYAPKMLLNFSLGAQRNFKVTVVGAAGGIGQPLSLLLKMNPLVSNLTLYDLVKTPGIAVDLSHVDTFSIVDSFMCPENLEKAIACSDVVVVPAGLPRKPGMSRDDLFKSNADIIAEVSKAIAKMAPKALIAIITNPVNSMVPLASKVLKEANVYDPNKLFGVTTLDIVRAKTFIGAFEKRDPKKITVHVIGGHAGITILPVISSCQPEFRGDEDDIVKITKRIQNAGTEVVEAKAGDGSATLSMAYAGAQFVNSLLRGLNNEKNVIECSYVESCSVQGVAFFSNPLQLGPDGIKKNFGLPHLSCFESAQLEAMLPELKASIQHGLDYDGSKK